MKLDAKRLPRHGRRGVSEVIAVLLLVVIVVSVVVIVVLFGVGIIHDLISGGVATPITASGKIVVPGTTSDNAVLSLSLTNSQAQSISNIQVTMANVGVTCPSPALHPPPCLTMAYDNVPLPSISVPPGETAVGTAPMTSTSTPFVAGNTYSVIMAVFFAGGSQVTLDVSVVAVS